MRLMRHILFLVISVVCVMHNAMADCKVGQTTIKDGQRLIQPVKQNVCKMSGAHISDPKAYDFTMYCVVTSLKCVAHTCPNNQKPDKNGICSGANPQEQARFHKNLLTHTYQKRNFFDACPSFDTNTIQNKVVKETQSVIADLNRKAKYACITDFATYNLSTALAIGLIERYNWSNGIGQIRADNCTTRQNNRFVSGGGRSIRCVADNGIYVEFLFGKMDGLLTSRENVAEAACPVFGFDALHSRGNQHRCHVKDKSKTTKNFAEFLRKTELMDIKHIDNGYFEIIPLRADIAKDKRDELSSYIYTDEFKNVVTLTSPHIQMLLKQYINQRLKAAGYDVKSVKFYSARSNAYYTADNTKWPVEIFVCKKNNCKTYIKAFQFRSLNGITKEAHTVSWNVLGIEEMSCLIKDGLFDSRHCFFLEEDINNEKKQCAATNSLIKSVLPNGKAGAKFDDDDGMCELHESHKNDKTLKALGIAAQVGMLVFATVATAGVGTVAAFVLAAGGALADGTVLWADIQINKASFKFLKKTSRCYDATCAKKYFEEEFKHMLQLMDRINDDEFRVIDSEMARLVQLLDDKYIGDTYVAKMAELQDETTGTFKNMAPEEVIENVATIVSLALSIGSGASKVERLISRSKKVKNTKFMIALAERMDAVRQAGKTAVGKVTKTASKTAKVASKARTPRELRDAVDPLFDSYVTEVKTKPSKSALFPKERLNDAEWETLNKSLEGEGVHLVKKGDFMSLERMDNAADAARTASKTAKVASKARTPRELRDAASETFDAHLIDAKNGKTVMLPKERLNDAEWETLNKSLEGEGMHLVKKGDYMSLERMDNAADATRTAGKTVARISAADAEAANAARLRKEASANFDTYLNEVKYNQTGIGRKLPKDRLTNEGWDAVNKSLAADNVQLVDQGDGYMMFVRADANLNSTSSTARTVSNTVTRISAADAEAANAAILRKEASANFDTYLNEVKYNQTGIGRKLPKNRLTNEGWDAVNKSLAADNVQLVDQGDGYMMFVRADHIDDVKSVTAVPVATPEKKVITQKEVDNIILRNEQVAKENQAYVEQVRNSGKDGKKWIALWEENAPKNQSLQDFQNEFGNNLDRAEKQFAGLSKADVATEYNKVIKNYHDKYDADSYIQFRAYVQEHGVYPTAEAKGFGSWSKEQFTSATELYDAESMMRLRQENGALYSTFDPEVSRIQNKYRKDVDASNKEWTEQIVPEYRKAHGNTDGIMESTDGKAWLSKRYALAEQYQYELGQIALKNKNVVAEQMVQNYDNLLSSNPRLLNRMSSWESLPQNEKMTLLQDVMDAYAAKYGTPKVKLVFQDMPPNPNIGSESGHYAGGTNRIYLNTNPSTGGVMHLGEDDMISTLLHEYGHAIDGLAPAKGSVGNQIGSLKLYTSKGKTYPLASTEQSSYTISGTVRKGGNWPLDNAIKRILGGVN